MISGAGWTCDAPSLGRYKRKGCRCDGCRGINARYAADYVKRRALRLPGRLVPATEARAHLLWLRQMGVGYRVAAERCSVTVSVPHVWRIISGEATRIDQRLEEALLAVTPDEASPVNRVDATLTLRRLHGLMALGWSSAELSGRLQWGTTGRLRRACGGTCTVRSAREVADLVRDLDGQPGDNPAVALYARRVGWAAIGSWEDDLEVLA